MQAKKTQHLKSGRQTENQQKVADKKNASEIKRLHIIANKK